MSVEVKTFKGERDLKRPREDAGRPVARPVADEPEVVMAVLDGALHAPADSHR
jgi:hypothetical protein